MNDEVTDGLVCLDTLRHLAIVFRFHRGKNYNFLLLDIVLLDRICMLLSSIAYHVFAGDMALVVIHLLGMDPVRISAMLTIPVHLH